MNIKKLGFLIVGLLIAIGIVFVVLSSDITFKEFNYTEVNDVLMTAVENWDDGLEESLHKKAGVYDFEFVVFNSKGNVLMKSTENCPTSLKEALQLRCSSTPIIVDGKQDGTLVICNDFAVQLQNYKSQLQLVFIISMVLMGCVMIGCLIYLNKSIIKPFQKLRKFASSVAAGNFDIPLEMDRDNVFGAFTESFDIMRDELARARDSERKANESKKELVASLSHDIKTPLASIEAMTELLAAKETDANQRNKMEAIWRKANQIELLVDNLFNSTLEELTELKVETAEEESTIISGLITNSDHKHQVQEYQIPQCVILCDKLRLQQVFDNIISNSYKYAGTKIEISSSIEKDFLKIAIRDFGEGVKEEELPKLQVKYFRGRNSEGKSGAGIGLFVSDYFMENMGGKLVFQSASPGLCTTIYIKLG